MAAGSTGGEGAGYLRAVLELDDRHASVVAGIAASVRSRPADKRLSVRKASTKSHTPHDKSVKKNCHLVDISGLDRVLRVDDARQVAVVQGCVTIAQLVDAAGERRLMPQVVPEIHDFTIAGLLNGLGVETSSHKYGGFHDIITAFQIVFADGTAACVDVTSDKELFDTVAGSYGTLGIVTAAVVKLRTSQPLVRTRYLQFRDLRAYCHAMKRVVGGSHVFVEGFVYSLESAVLMLGDFVESVTTGEGSLWDPNARGAEWIHQHALTVSSQRKPATAVGSGLDASEAARASAEEEAAALGAIGVGTDFMRTRDYFFRSERGWLWTLEAFVGLPALTSTEWGRSAIEDRASSDYARMDNVFGFAGGSINNPHWTPEDLERVFVQQDTIWHIDRLELGVRWVAEHVGVWPLWHCPSFVDRHRGPFTSTPADRVASDPRLRPPTHIVDMGIYGEATASDYRVRHTMRELQKIVDAPTMFGNVYLSPTELESSFDMATYRRVRARVKADGAFLPIEAKVCVYDATKPIQGRISLWRLRREGLIEPLQRAAIVTTILAAVGVAVAVAGSRHEGGVRGVISDVTTSIRDAATATFERVRALWA